MRNLAFLILTISLFILLSCSVKVPSFSLYDTLLAKGLDGRMLKGKVYVEGDFSKLLNIPSSGSYGEFYLSQTYFLLKITPPMGNEIIFEWDEERGARLILPYKSKVYYPKDEYLRLKDLPSYFLGLKETSRDFHLHALHGEYNFNRENLEGRVHTDLFFFFWRIKGFEEVDSIPKPIDTTGFKEKRLRLPF